MVKSIRDEFIGESIEIVSSRNKQLIGLTGKIVDETRDSFKVLVNKRNFREFKMIFKKGNTFKIGGFVVQGLKIAKRPEDRIKLKS
ncbi:MAG TPA: ribonuclease P protein subunit [Alphaproteobacteria bacterium]|nr:ribonuclease P protein subunit [Alphaproteobacteria bacterium]